MIKRIFVIVLVFVAITSNAQEGTRSPYSFYGIGVQKFKGTVENRSMGGLSVLADSIHLNLQNPASYGELKLTTYSLGASYNNFNISNSTESSSGDNASLDYLAIGIPAGKFGFGFGLIPMTSVGYNLDNEDSNGVEQRFTGSGGVNKVFLAAGVKVNKNLSIGFDFNYNFGNIENTVLVLNPNVQRSTRQISDANLSGFSFSAGLMYKAKLTDKLELSSSVVASPKYNLTAENTLELATIGILPDGIEDVNTQNIDVEDEDVEIPAEFKFATGIGESKKWFVGAEYGYTDEGKFTNVSLGQNNVEYQSASKFKLGGFYIPKYNSLTSYFSRVVYRAGFRYEETGLLIDGNSIDEFGMSFGVGLPVGRLFSNLNIGLEYGQRGTTDNGLVKEQFFNVSIGLSLNDKWFRKIKFN